ncbi:MAG: PQQ-dependent sugar dehydrogenase, partial [Pseudomonadales bacterium]|nr:PQQ-dependent sugar dehydrogenase [Pseudomonadales bacterium]
MLQPHNKTWRIVIRALLLCSGCSLLLALPPPVSLKPIVITPDKEPFIREVLTDQLQQPWAMDFLPDDRLLITEHKGTIALYSKKSGLRRIADWSDRVALGQPQLGMLDIAARTIQNNTSIYVTYTAMRQEEDGPHYTLCLLRQQFIANRLSPREEKTFCLTPWGKETSQFGGAIAFDEQDNLLLTTGDRAHREQAQNPAS